VKETVALVGESAVAVPMVGALGDAIGYRDEGGDVIAGLSLLIVFTSNL
jgi:hypothetical protein